MNKKVLAIILAIVVIGAGLFMFMSSDDEDDSDNLGTTNQTSQTATNDTPATESEDSDAAEVTISYTDDGFEPAEQTITAGQTVLFVNNSSRSMWVASNDHPVHSDLPGFDNGQGVGPGEAYAYTFVQVGEWGFHNHLNDSDEGEITVTAN